MSVDEQWTVIESLRQSNPSFPQLLGPALEVTEFPVDMFEPAAGEDVKAVERSDGGRRFPSHVQISELHNQRLPPDIELSEHQIHPVRQQHSSFEQLHF